jgi:hypothetical protein
VWEVDPLFCPQCQREMRIVLMINNAQIIDHILRYVGIWVDEVCNHGTRIAPSMGPPGGMNRWRGRAFKARGSIAPDYRARLRLARRSQHRPTAR